MELTIGSRFKNAWNAFTNKNIIPPDNTYYGGSYYRPDRLRLTRGNERSIVTAIFNKIALDISTIDIRHCKLDEDDRLMDYISSSLMVICLIT